MYNYKESLEKTCKVRVLERTNKLFYVCCTRAKENLAIFIQNPSNLAINQAIEWFG
jgi:DNA helicase-2/ATP-dependent DNA helicase PcrA